MKEKSELILDPHWRTVSELFSDNAISKLDEDFKILWGKDDAMPEDLLKSSLDTAHVLISAAPFIQEADLQRAQNLQTVIEVAGAFPDTIDYAACKSHGVEVLSCSPGFQRAVAEMALAMALAGARGLVSEHELFRKGSEHWLSDNTRTDFSLYECCVGFVGYGAIARATHQLLKPFNVNVTAYDPWLSDEVASKNNVELCSLDELMSINRCVFITASPSNSNYQMINSRMLDLLPDSALLVVLSRAHLVDFEALVDVALSGRVRIATDVFPEEPLPLGHRARKAENLILSPHRAAAVSGGRQLIGDMIVHDLQARLAGLPDRRLQRVPAQINELTGVGDADKVGSIALTRE
ncbi:MAG: NAD(P)-dependent oxidoreductase [Granulosicoccus sp.]